MTYSAYSNVGGRGNNEDLLGVEEANGCLLFIVADGLGGVEAGELASETAVGEIKNQFLFEPQSFSLRDSIIAANTEILRLQQSTGKQMKTTVAAVLVTPDRIRCAHIGDTRIYLFDENGIVYQSVDHSASQRAVAAGEITADGIRQHPNRNVLTKALGANEELTAEETTFDVKGIKACLLCSDGFWEYVYEDEMTDMLSKTDDAESWLTEMRRRLQTRIPRKNDNNTAIFALF